MKNFNIATKYLAIDIRGTNLLKFCNKPLAVGITL